MHKKHEKSVCCKRKIIRFGNRRRQCVGCERTWRVWQKKTGRKRKRISIKFVESFFKHEISSMLYLSRKKKVSETFVQNKIAKSRDLFLETTSWPKIPKGDLIIVADAVVEVVEKKWRTVYLILVRGVNESDAFILPPIILDGIETSPGWHQAFIGVDSGILARAKAVVSDGHRGIILEALDRGWIIQRCHFHLLAAIQSRRSRSILTRHKDESLLTFKHVDIVLKCRDMDLVQQSLNILEEISWISTSRVLRKILCGFVTNHKDFRSYIYHPNLNLPVTNNTAESLASIIADLKRRMRGFPTMNSFAKWVTALLKFRQTIKCNKYQPS